MRRSASFFIFFGALFLVHAPHAPAADMTMTTYYPAPSGNYNQMKAKKVTLTSMNQPGACTQNFDGVMYYDQSTKTVKICNGTDWSSLGGGVWSQSGAAVYPSALAASSPVDVNVGIGIKAPSAPLHVKMPNGQTIGVLVTRAGTDAAIAIQGTANSLIYLGSAGNNTGGVVGYDDSAKAMTFRTNGILGMTLDKDRTLKVEADVKAQNVTAVTNITASNGTVTGVNVTATSAVKGQSVTATGNVTAASVMASGDVIAGGSMMAKDVIVTGSLSSTGTAQVCFETYGGGLYPSEECPPGMLQVGYQFSSKSILCRKMQLKACSATVCTPNCNACAWPSECSTTGTRKCVRADCSIVDESCGRSTDGADCAANEYCSSNRHYFNPTCLSGSCVLQSEQCTAGCTDDHCTGSDSCANCLFADPCAMTGTCEATSLSCARPQSTNGVSCGAAYCIGSTRYYSGTCSSGTCGYLTQTCPSGCANGVCAADGCKVSDTDCVFADVCVMTGTLTHTAKDCTTSPQACARSQSTDGTVCGPKYFNGPEMTCVHGVCSLCLAGQSPCPVQQRCLPNGAICAVICDMDMTCDSGETLAGCPTDCGGSGTG